jgi:hypothetical protein
MLAAVSTASIAGIDRRCDHLILDPFDADFRSEVTL